MSHFETRARRLRRDTDRKTNGWRLCEAAPTTDFVTFLTVHHLTTRAGSGLRLLCLQRFMGTMDNWDPAVAEPLADPDGNEPGSCAAFVDRLMQPRRIAPVSASLIRRASTLVVNGIYDEMLPVRDSYWLSENLPDAVLLTTGRASLLQFHRSVTRQAAAFLESESAFAPC
jgi:hypothetical protein